jgi:hypothetical protein
MEQRYGEFEAADSVAAVLAGYDAAADRWRFRLAGDFWDAVGHAHALGWRGAGRRVAIVDSGCDRSLPRLGRRVDALRGFASAGGGDDPLGHGTAVALLISEIAPEARLDVYRVATEDGQVDLDWTREAIEAAAASDADVICLSLGDRRPLEPSTSLEPPRVHPLTAKQDFAPEDPPCALCTAAERAAAAGKLVFAAVGNSVIDTYCPSRVPAVIAVGFQRRVRLDLGDGRMIEQGWPMLEESPYADLFVAEIEGVLGSSFACPLHAGVGALGIRPGTLRAYVEAFALSAGPKRGHAMIDQMGGAMRVPAADGRAVDAEYKAALARLPHVHSPVQAALRPDLDWTDPAGCPFCGVYAEELCSAAGFWLCETERHDSAIGLLSAVRAFAPWSAKACFYLGLTHHTTGDAEAALEAYEAALAIRPHHPQVEQCIARLPGRH